MYSSCGLISRRFFCNQSHVSCSWRRTLCTFNHRNSSSSNFVTPDRLEFLQIRGLHQIPSDFNKFVITDVPKTGPESIGNVSNLGPFAKLFSGQEESYRGYWTQILVQNGYKNEEELCHNFRKAYWCNEEGIICRLKEFYIHEAAAKIIAKRIIDSYPQIEALGLTYYIQHTSSNYSFEDIAKTRPFAKLFSGCDEDEVESWTQTLVRNGYKNEEKFCLTFLQDYGIDEEAIIPRLTRLGIQEDAGKIIAQRILGYRSRFEALGHSGAFSCDITHGTGSGSFSVGLTRVEEKVNS